MPTSQIRTAGRFPLALVLFHGVLALAAGGLIARPAAAAPLKIMPLGDSITAGMFYTGFGGGYRDRLAQRLTTAGVDFKFVGTLSDYPSTFLVANGDTAHEGHGYARIDNVANNLTGDDGLFSNGGGHWLDGIPGVRDPIAPDVFLLLIGTNDFGQQFHPETAINRLDALISQLHALRPTAQIMVSNLLPRRDAVPMGTVPYDDQIATGFNPFVPAVVAAHRANGEQVGFVNLHDSIDPTLDLFDGLHPFPTGYDKMGNAWADALLNYVPAPVPEPGALAGTLVAAIAATTRRRRPV